MDALGRLEIINMDGEIVFCRWCRDCDLCAFQRNIDLPEGAYLLRFFCDGECEKKRLVQSNSVEKEEKQFLHLI